MNRFDNSICQLLAGLLMLLASTTANANGETDYIPPVAVCTDQLNVSLTSSGTAIVLAQSFDEGSYDNYCLAAIKVKKTYDPYDDFGPWVEFDCDDIGQLVSVELKAIDCAGNTNSCWVDVWVEDKLPPAIWCPYDVTVDCNQTDDWNILNQATATDACGVASITFDDVDNTGSCGNGYITRVWKATDLYGNMSTCTQTVHVVDNTPVVVNFPPDYVTYDCETADDLLPENLPAPFDGPQVLYEDCELIAESYQDWVFTAAPNSCIKIIREWKVIDWCSYSYGGNQGIWQGVQILKIQDTIPPTATCPTDLTVSTNYGACTANVNLPLPTNIQDCLADVEVSIMGDLGPDTYIPNVPIGQYEVGYLLEDGCNNSSTCHITVNVVDGISPGPVCINGVSLSLMQNGEAELWASDIEPESSIDNCTNYQHLQFRIGPEPSQGQTTPPDDDVITFNCDDLGVNIVALWVGDAAGNWAYCLTTAHVQDNQNVCTGGPPIDSTFYIGGYITDEQGDKIPEVEIAVDSNAYGIMSDSLGHYALGYMPMNEDYTITPYKYSDPQDGLSMSDLIILAKHLMGVDTMDSPYQIIAADVDQNGTLNNDDMLLMHLTILGLENGFPDSASWRFIPADFVFPIDYPLSVNFPESITINNLNSDVEDADFIGIKLGDLDASMMETDTSGLNEVEDRTADNPAYLSVKAEVLKAGEVVEVPVYWPGGAIDALKLKLEHAGLNILEVNTLYEGLLYTRTEGTQASITYMPAGTGYLDGATPIFSLTLSAKHEVVLKEALAAEQASAVFYKTDGGLSERGLLLNFLDADAQLSLYKLYPNPFRTSTVFYFNQQEPGTVSLTIWNTNGQRVYQEERPFTTGSNTWTVESTDIGESGAFIYQLTNGKEQLSGRLLLLEE
jgi:hypothetical protein